MGARIAFLALAIAASVRGSEAPGPQRILPGLQPDGSTLLHNQWPIHPVGDQVGLGEFPVNMAVDPSGRLAAVLHAGHGGHEIRVVDIATGRTLETVPVHEAFCGIAYSADGKRLVCSGGSDGVLHVFSSADNGIIARGDVRVADAAGRSVVAGFALSRDGAAAIVALAFDSRVVKVDLKTGTTLWTADLGGQGGRSAVPVTADGILAWHELVADPDPLNVAWDERGGRAYVSLWGESSVAVVDSHDGRVIGRWATGLHPNELLLSGDGRLFVSNGGLNTVTVLDTRDGQVTEVLSSAVSPGEPPGSTPDSLALSPDGDSLFVANAYTDTVAVFDVGIRGQGRPRGFVPTGWFPTSVRLTPDGATLLVVSARGLAPAPNGGAGKPWTRIYGLYSGSLGIVHLPRGDEFGRKLTEWTRIAQRCRPAPAPAPLAGDPIPDGPGGSTPIRYVVYIIKENRTYDQVLGRHARATETPQSASFPRR